MHVKMNMVSVAAGLQNECLERAVLDGHRKYDGMVKMNT